MRRGAKEKPELADSGFRGYSVVRKKIVFIKENPVTSCNRNQKHYEKRTIACCTDNIIPQVRMKCKGVGADFSRFFNLAASVNTEYR